MRNQYQSNDYIHHLIYELAAGRFQQFEEFFICPKENGRIEIIAYFPDNIKLISEIQVDSLYSYLEKVKLLFYSKIKKAKLLKKYIAEKGLDFSLNYDYGGGSVVVCRQINGVFEINSVMNSISNS